MKKTLLCLLLVVLLTAVACAALVTRVTFSARAPNPACDYIPVDLSTAPYPIDPAKIVGRPMRFLQSKAGNWAYRINACDNEGDPFEVELLSPPADFSLTPDDAGGNFIIAGRLPVGVNYYYFRVKDAPDPTVADPCEVVYTLVVRGTRGNKWPWLWW